MGYTDRGGVSTHLADLLTNGKPATESDIGLQVTQTTIDQSFEIIGCHIAFSSGDRYRRLCTQLLVALQIILGQGFFQPLDPQWLQEPGTFQRHVSGPLTAHVHHQITFITEHIASGLDMRNINVGITTKNAPTKLGCG